MALLDAIVPMASFRMPGTVLGPQAYQRGYAESQTFVGIQRLHTSWFIHAEVNIKGVPESLFRRLVEVFRCVLGSSVVGGGIYPALQEGHNGESQVGL